MATLGGRNPSSLHRLSSDDSGEFCSIGKIGRPTTLPEALASVAALKQNYLYHPAPFPRDFKPQLDTDEIISCLEQGFGDLVYLLLGRMWREDVSDYTRHNMLTFEGVLNPGEPGLLAHFPTTSPLKWYFENHSHDIHATYSTTVSSRVDPSFHQSDADHLDLPFALRLPPEYRAGLRAAYLFKSNLSPGRYLQTQVDPHSNLVASPVGRGGHYASSFRPSTQQGINKQDWVEFGIPEHEVETWIGSFWWASNCVRDYICGKGYDNSKQDGTRYAQDHGYEELMMGELRMLSPFKG
ncbi:hypothetical protein PQX77_006511 [Marasmius sp. AFHP31]|nr:hypothetical protein PQX77_006511 [Marasmius sp. AFHP31]